MLENMKNFENFTTLPTYNDGFFYLYKICQKKNGTKYPIEYIKKVNNQEIWYEEISLTDKLRFEAEERNKKITLKIRIPQMKEIDSLCVVKIGNEYHKVFNAYHFTNKEGFKESDLTLEEYSRVKFEEDVVNDK